MTSRNEFYTHGHSRPVVQAHSRRTVADSAQFLVPHLCPGVDLLDFGCGPGSITADLASHIGPSGKVVGVDANREALDIAERDAAAPNVEYVQASVYELPFPNGAFDIAYGHQILQHLGDPVSALREIRRVLRPNGLVAVRDADYGSMTHYPHYPELDRWLDTYQRVARANGGEPNAGRRLHEWVAEAGFSSIRISVSSWQYTTPEQRKTWADLWSGRIQVARFAERAVELAPNVDIPALAAAWTSWANEPYGWFAFMHGEVVASR